MADLCFIEDGYSRQATILAAPGLHPALSFRFRPALAAVRMDNMAARDLNGTEQALRTGKILEAHIESWDAKLRDGSAAPIKAQQLTRLQPALFAKVLDVVLGYAPADEAADAKN